MVGPREIQFLSHIFYADDIFVFYREVLVPFNI